MEDALKSVIDIIGSVSDISSAGWGGVVALVLAAIAVITAFVIMKMNKKAAAKKASDESAAKDHAANPVLNDTIDHAHEDAEEIIKRSKNGSS